VIAFDCVFVEQYQWTQSKAIATQWVQNLKDEW
jgi:hypothetical protein